MNRKFINDLLLLLNTGWRPYNHRPIREVYDRIGCPYIDVKRKEPIWFVRGEIFMCISCNKNCALERPEGFILPLPIAWSDKSGGKGSAAFNLTPDEMVSRRALLRVDEAAYCLNINERTVYDWIAEGKLRRVKEKPVRVSAEDVARCMSNFLD